MENKIGKILSIMLIVSLCAVAIALVGPGNAAVQEDAESYTPGKAVEENDGGDSSSAIIILVRDPSQIDGTAYAFAYLQPTETLSHTMDKEKSNEAGIYIAFVLLLMALVIGIIFVYNKSDKKISKKNKAIGFLMVFIMIISIFTVMLMKVSTDNNREDIIQVDDATDITESSAILSGEVNNLEETGTLEASFEWGLNSGPPYAYETETHTISSAGSFNETIDGLTRETTYYYRMKAVGSDDTYYSRERSFTTIAGKGIIYVHQAATGTGDGSSWENAFTDLEEAINAADPTDEILVALSDQPGEIGLALRLKKSESGDILIDETLIVGPNDTLEGSGTIDNDVTVSGVFNPGHSPGKVEINGDLTIIGTDTTVIDYPDVYPTSSPIGADTVGTLKIEIGGVNPGPGSPVDDGYDQIIVDGNVYLGGTLDVVLINNFNPQVGQTFDFLVIKEGSTGTIDSSKKFDDATGLFGFGDGTLYFEIVQGTDKVQLEVKQFGGGGLQLKAIGAHAIGIGKVLCDYFSDTSYSGSLDNVDILGLISGSVSFSISKDVVDVDLDGEITTPNDDFYDDATLFTFSLSSPMLYVGKSGFGLYVTSGELGIASLKASDGSSWLAVLATDIGGTLTLPKVTASLDSLTVKINKGYSGASPLDWTKAVDLDKDGIFSEYPGNTHDIIDFDSDGGTTDDQVKYTADYLNIGGSLINLDIFSFVTGSAGFEFVQQPVDVDVDKDNKFDISSPGFLDLKDADLTTLELTATNVFVGVPNSVGFSVQSGSLAFASIKPEDTNDNRSWLALSASVGTATLTGIEGLTASGSLDIKINRGYDGSTVVSGAALDWANNVNTNANSVDGDDPFKKTAVTVGSHNIILNGDLLQASGSLTIDLFGYVTGTAGFEFVQKLVDVDVDKDKIFDISTPGFVDLKDANITTLELTATDVFVGVPNGVGLSVKSGSLAFASIKPEDTNDNRSWLALSASVGTATLTGIEGLTATGSLDIKINRGYDGSTVVSGAALDWANNVNTNADSVHGEDPFKKTAVTVGSHNIILNGDLLQASGSLTIDLFGYVTGTAGFEFVQKLVDVDVDKDGIFDISSPDFEDLKDADLTTLELTATDVFVGVPNSVGLSVKSGSLAFASIKPEDTSDNRSWLALSASVGTATLTGIEGLTATGSLDIKINRGYDGSTVVSGAALDWANNVNTNANSVDGDDPFKKTTVSVGSQNIILNGDLLKASGSLTIDLFGFLTGSVAFEFIQDQADVDVVEGDGDFNYSTGDDLNDADIVMLDLTVTDVFIGIPGSIGFKLTSGQLGFGTIKPKASDNDDRSFLTMTSSVSGAELVGIQDLTLSVDILEVQINRAYIGSTVAPGDALNWKTGINLDNDTDEGDPLVGTPVEVGTLTLDHETDYLRIVAGGTLNAFGFFYASGSFSFERSSTTVTVWDGLNTATQEDVEVEYLTVGTVIDNAFAGVNGPYWRDLNDDGNYEESEVNPAALGLSLKSVKFAMSLMSVKTDNPDEETDLRTWTALIADVGEIGFVGIEDITAKGGSFVKINTYGGGKLANVGDEEFDEENDKVVDFKTSFPTDGGLVVDTGTSSVKIDFDTKYLSVGGWMALNLSGFFYFDGSFAFEKTTTTVDTVGGTLAEEDVPVEMLTVGAKVTHAFVGSGGPYWTGDTNENEEVDAPGETNQDAFGLSMVEFNFALALFKFASDDPEETDLRNWMAVSASVQQVSLVGLDNIVISGGGAFKINTGGGGIKENYEDEDYEDDNDTVIDFKSSFPTGGVDGGLEVQLGDGSNILLDWTTDYLFIHVEGALEVGGLDLSGGFSFEKEGTDIGVAGDFSFEYWSGTKKLFGFSVDGAMLIKGEGVAMEFGISLHVDIASETFVFTGAGRFFMNYTGVSINEIAEEPVDLILPTPTGKNEILKVSIETFKVKIGTYVTFEAGDIILDLTATGSEHLIEFGEAGLSLKIGSSVPAVGGLEGNVGNFAIRADFLPIILDEFYASISVEDGLSTADLKLPIPISVSELGLRFNPGAVVDDVLVEPWDFSITLSGGLDGSGGFPIVAMVDGLEFNLGYLVDGKFPFTKIDGIQFGIEDMSIGPMKVGGKFTFGIVSIDDGAGGTKTAFYGGIEGTFSYSGIGGGIQLYICELGPLVATISVGGLVEPTTGFVFGIDKGGFAFGGEPWPSPEGPEDLLTTPVFQDPFDTSLDAIKKRVEETLEAGHNTFEDSFTMAVTGTITNIYVQGMIKGDVTVAMNIGWPDSWGDPLPDVKLLINGDIELLGMPLGFAGFLIDLSDPLVPILDFAFQVPAPGNPLGFLFPSNTTILGRLDTSGIIEMPIIGIATFVSETFEGVLELVLEGMAEDLEMNHSSSFSKLLLDGGLVTTDVNYSVPNGSVDDWENAIVIDSEFLVDRILGEDDIPEYPDGKIVGLLPTSFEALDDFSIDDVGRAIELIGELVPAIISQASTLAEAGEIDYIVFFDKLVDVVLNALIEGIDAAWETFDPSLVITARIQPMIFGIPLGEPDVDVELRLDKYAFQFSFAGSIRDLLLNTVFAQFGGSVLANLPAGLDGINDSTYFSFKREFPEKLFTAIVTGMADPGETKPQELVDLMVDLMNPFTGWEVLFASTITLFGFKLGSVSGFIFGPPSQDVLDDPESTFNTFVKNLDPDGDGEPNENLVEYYTDKVNVIPINTKEQYDNIVEYGGLLMTGQLYMPDIIADPISVITTLPEWASVTVEISSGEFLTIQAVEPGTNHNKVNIIFLDGTNDGVTAGSETVVYDDSNITFKRLIITVEEGVSTAGDVIAAINSEGTFTATTASLSSIINMASVTSDPTSGGTSEENASATFGSTTNDFELYIEASSTGLQYNDDHIIFQDTVEVGSETAVYDDTNSSYKTLTISVDDGTSTAAHIIAAINNDGTFTATTPDSMVVIVLPLTDNVTSGGVNGIDWTLPELEWDDLTDIMDNFTKVKEYIEQIIEGLTRQSEWAKLQIYIASPAELFNVAANILDTGSTQAFSTVTSLSDSTFEMVITAREYGPAYNDVTIILQDGATAGQETVVYDHDAGTLTITIQNGVSISSEVKRAINKEGPFFAKCEDDLFVMTISDLVVPDTSGGEIKPLSVPKDLSSLPADVFQKLLDILNAGFIEGYSDLKLFGINLGTTFIEGTINGIRAEADIPWLAGLTASLETGWKEISLNQFFFDLVTSPLAITVVEALNLPGDPEEVFAFLLDEDTPDVQILFPVGAFEAMLSSANFTDWLVDNFGLPDFVGAAMEGAASFDFFFGAYTPGLGGPEDSGVKRNGGFRLEASLDIEGFIDDAWFEFEIEFFNILEWDPAIPIPIPNFVARASLASLTLPGLEPDNPILSLKDFFLEIVKTDDEITYQLNCQAALLGLRLNADGDFNLSSAGLYGGMLLELTAGVEGLTKGGTDTTPASVIVVNSGQYNDFRIDSVASEATAVISSSYNNFELILTSEQPGIDIGDVTIEFEEGDNVSAVYEEVSKVLTITVVHDLSTDQVTTAAEIADAINSGEIFDAVTRNGEAIAYIDTLSTEYDAGGTYDPKHNGVKIKMIDDGSITDDGATAVYRNAEIVIRINDGVTTRSAAIAAVDALDEWDADVTSDESGGDGVITSENLMDSDSKWNFEFSVQFILMVNTTGVDEDWYWENEDKYIPLPKEQILRVHADGDLRFVGLVFEGTFDMVASTTEVEMTFAARLVLGDLGALWATGALVIDSNGLAGRLEVNLLVGEPLGGVDIGLDITGYFLFEVNTGADRYLDVPDFEDPTGLEYNGLVTRSVLIKQGLLVRAIGTLDFLGFITAKANFELEWRTEFFAMEGNAELIIGDLLNVKFGFDVLITDEGVTLGADVSVNAKIADAIQIVAGAQPGQPPEKKELKLNTVGHDVYLDGEWYDANSFYLHLYGEVIFLGVLRFEAGFKVQVGGKEFKHDAITEPKAPQPVGDDDYLYSGEWAVSFGAQMNFFGMATLEADGWFNHRGHFAIHLYGEVVIGTRSFGIIGEFNIDASYSTFRDPVFAFSGGASAKIVLFGWDVAGIWVDFDYNSTTGKITITGRVLLDFWLFTIDISHTFTIGFFKIPPSVFLAGSYGTKEWLKDGDLYLNMGPRAGYRNLMPGETNETFYVRHVEGTSGDERVEVSCFGRTQRFSKVERIIADGYTGDDMIVIEQGVVSPVELKGGSGKDVIIHKGPGGGTSNEIRGGSGDDYIELGSAIAVSVDLYGDAGNDYIQGGPNDDTIEGGDGDDQILGGGGVDTIEGGEGSDMITGGLDADDLYGETGPDVFYWSKGDGQDNVIDGGDGSDTLVITANDTDEVIEVSRNASDIVVTWTSENPALALTGISIEGLDINLAEGSDTFTMEDILGSGLTDIALDLGDYDTNDEDADIVLLKGSSANDSFILDSAGGLLNVTRVGVYNVTITNAHRASGDALTIETYEGFDTINAAAAVEDLLAMTFEAGADDDILIGTPFDDVLDSGTGSDIVTGNTGMDTFIDDSGPEDTDTLVEIQDSDMSLFNNMFVVGTIMADDGTSQFFKSSSIDEQNAEPEDPKFPAPVVFPLQDTGDVYAAGAVVESLLHNGVPIFERAYLTGGDSNNLIVVGDRDNSITVDGSPLSATLWSGEATLDNGANRGITGDSYIEYYIINLNGTSGARISILDTGGSDGYDEIYVYCTDSADKVYLNAIRSGAEVTGIVVVGDQFGSGTVQKMTVVNGDEVPVYYQIDGGERVQRTDDEGKLIWDLTDPENPTEIWLETTTDTGDPVMVSEPNPDRDDMSFRNVERVTIKTLGGKDTLISDDTAVPMVVKLGDGDDTVVIGYVPQINDPGNKTPEYPEYGIPIADTENMTNGNSAVMTIYGEDGDDEFEVNHNIAKLYLHGGAHDDTFVINTFLTLADQENPDDIGNLSTLFGGGGNNRYEYLQNAPVTIAGGTGIDTIIINGTPIGDVFIVTDMYAAGAGRIVPFTDVEKITINAAGGADKIYILSTNPELEVTIRGGSGDDTIHLGGNPPTLAFDPPAITYYPKPYQVQDPPVTVYDIITWDIGQTTISIDWDWWYYGFSMTNAKDAVRDYLNAIVDVMRNYIPGLKLTTSVNDIVDQTYNEGNIQFSKGYGRWWIFDKEVYVTFNPPAFKLEYPRQVLPPLRTVVPDPITTDPAPFALKADASFDLTEIKGKVIIDGGDTHETNGDQIFIHNQYSGAVSGTLTDLDLTGLGLGQGVEFEAFERMTILLGDQNDSLTINDTLAGPLTVSLGGGNDTTYIEKISGKTTILGGAGNDTINVASNSESLNDIMYNLTVKGDTGLMEEVTHVAYDSEKHDDIQSLVYINSAPNLEYTDTGGNVTYYALEEKARIIFEQDGKVWVRVVVIDPAFGQAGKDLLVKDLVQERDGSGNLLWRDPNGNKTTSNPGNYPPWLIPVNRTLAVPFTRSKIVETLGAGSDTLNVYDSGNTDSVTATLTDSTLTVSSMPGLLTYDLNEMAALPVDDLLNIYLGTGDDVFNVQATSVLTNLILNDGDERVYVSDLADLDLLTETDFLLGVLDDIEGTLNIDAGIGRHLLMISDKDASVGDSDVLITDQQIAGLPSTEISITGLAPAAITYKANPTSGNFADGITIWTSAGSDTITIDGTHRRDMKDEQDNDIRTITTLNTGEGDDTITVSLDAATDGFFVLNTQEHNDIVDASDSTLPLIIFGGDGYLDEITGGEGNDVIFGDRGRVYYTDESGAIVTEIGNGGPGDKTDGIAHTDRFEERADASIGGSDTILGGGGDDLIFGEIGDDLIHGGSGSDTIFGDDGDDTIFGEGGDDHLAGGDGDDYVEGNADNDVILGDNGLFGSVILTGGAGDDTMLGGSGDDEMYGQGGHDRMWGNAGDDIMWGGDGADWMFGNEDDDDIYGEAGADILFGDSGEVVLTGGQISLIQTTDPGIGNNDMIEGNDGDDIIFGGTANDDIWGNAGDDVILGDNGRITMSGGAIELIETTDPAIGGSDTIEGNDGADIILGGAEGDDIWGHANDDVILGDNGYIMLSSGVIDLIETTDPATGGSDTIEGNDGEDIILGGAADDDIWGNAGDDIILGDNGRITMPGGAIELIETTDPSIGGDDTIEGNESKDILLGGASSDVIWGHDGDDVILGDNGKVTMSGEMIELIETTDPATGGSDTIEGNDGADIILGGAEGDNIWGNAGDDVILGDNGYIMLSEGMIELIETSDPTIGGDDNIEGNQGEDIILGGAADDDIWGNDGDDVILGDNGKITMPEEMIELIETTDPATGGSDTLEGNDGHDIILGGAFGDHLKGNAGIDIILGDNGKLDYVLPAVDGAVSDPSTLDLITTTFPEDGYRDTITCGAENDITFGGTAGDIIYGNEGNDLLFGDHAKVERVVGSNIDLTTIPVPSFKFTSIFTGAGDGGDGDMMHGNAGDDILIGGQGDDNMFGNEDDDDMIGGHNVAGGIDELDILPGSNDIMDGGSGDDAMAGDNAEILRRTDSVSPRIRTLNGTTLYDENDNADVTATHQINPSGAAGRDITLYDHSDNPIPDTFGNDCMAGGPGEDVMFGQLGDDIMQGDSSVAESVSATDPSVEGENDGDDYIEGNGGKDLIFGNLGQDDIIGGSSELFGLVTPSLRPDDSDTIFGGAGTDVARNDLGDTSDTGHAQDADMILGDNGNIYRLVGTNGVSTGAFLTFSYDDYTGEEGLKIIPRVAELLDYTPGGLDYLPTAAQAASDIGAADEIHGESGDDFIYGMAGNDILFGEGQDDDLIGGYGHDWISGGTGQDGVLGDDGRIYTSRNGTEEPLYGIGDLSGELNKYIYSPGKVQQATINVEDELKKTVNLTPFKLGDPNDLDYSHKNFDPQYADDVIYGGWGSDFLHGGDGDDAISGAEALEDSAVLIFADYEFPDPNREGTVIVSSYTNPYNPGNVLGFEAYRAEEFALYDEYDPRSRIFLETYDFLLNFHARDIVQDGSPAENNDGDDVIFGDLGNDWLVGGTGQDHLYGGYGCDLLNADDDLDTNSGFNDAPDTDSSYEDFAFGGAGRDVLIANTGGDRLTDWAGEFNSYIVPYAPFGFFTISRAPQPQLMQFLYDLSESDGADPTRPSDTGADPDRNGEPEGEIGLVMQQDFDWRDQTGAPDDPQPGNIPGGSRDVLRSASFNGGSMEAFAPDSGVWEVNGGALKVSAESIGGDAASVFHVGDMLPIYYEIQASIYAEKPTGGWKSNAYVIFDYHSPTDFKFAGINISIDKIQMGHRTPDGWIVDVQKSCKLKPNQNYNMLVAVNGTVVTVVVDGSEVFYHVFEPRIIDGFSYGLNQGMVGVGSENSRGTYDNIAVQVLPPQYTFEETEDFSDAVEDLVFDPVAGDWQVMDCRYEGVPTPDTAISLVDLGIGRGLEANCILELEATLSTETMGGFVFDYYGPQDYKFVMIRTDTNQVIIGHHTSKHGMSYDAVIEKTLRAGVDYTLSLTLKGSTLSVSLGGYMVWGHVFNAIIVDGDFGLIAVDGTSSFDEVMVKTDDSAFKY